MKFQWPISFSKKVSASASKASAPEAKSVLLGSDTDISTSASKASAPEAKSVLLGSDTDISTFLLFGLQTNMESPSSALDLYNKSSAVSIPVNMIADAFASIDPVIQIGDEIIYKHPVLDLLNKPSPFFTRSLLQQMLATNYLVTGECEIAALGNINRPPIELQPLSASSVTVIEGQNGYAKSMTVSGITLPGEYPMKLVGNRLRYLQGNLREIKQIRNYSTIRNSLLRGQSPLVSASKEVRQHIKGGDHNISILDNGGRLSVVFHFPEKLTTDEFEETKDRVNEQYGGTSNAGKIGVTAGEGLDIKTIGTSNKDMDFANLQNMAQRAVALQYKVPLPLITTDASTFNNYKEARAALYMDAVLPLADRLYEGLTDMLMPRFGIDPTEAWITYDKTKIEAIMSVALEQLKTRSSIGIETDNELRASIGRAPLDGGDVIYKPANLVPAGTDVFAEPGTELGSELGTELGTELPVGGSETQAPASTGAVE